jgi:hypothetical protein
LLNIAKCLLVISLVLVAASPSRGEVGVIVLEPVGALGFFTRVGHAGTYFSNICPDGSPVKMRLCVPGERGGVVSKYSPLSEHENYDWAIVPFEESFYRNCSDQAKSILDLILPHIDVIGDRTDGVTMHTPKGLAKALVARGLEHPELHLRVRRYPQIPGTFSRSRDVLFPMENTYKSIGFAPWWFFGGFREVALGAMFYHEVISPFGMLQSSRDFISPEAAELTLEQRRLRHRQDEIRQALAVAQSRNAGWSTLSELNVRVFQRLGEIETAKRAEVNRVAGSKARWQELDRGFQSMIPPLSRRLFMAEALMRHLEQFEPEGTLSEQLLQYFEANGNFYVDEARGGPWISLPLVDGEMASTGLSTSQILAGDPRLAALVLAAVIDHNLYQTEARREDIEYVDKVFTLFKQATEAIERRPARER